jgi:hypothetical protein
MFGERLRPAKFALVLLLGIFVSLVAGCSGQASDNLSSDSGKQETSGTKASSEKSAVEETIMEKTEASGEAAELARVQVGSGRSPT